MKAPKASIDQKTIKMTKAKKECQDLKKPPKDKRGDDTGHTQRLQEACLKLREVTNGHLELAKTRTELESSMKAMKAGIDQKTIKMKKAKKECQDLKKMPEDKRGDKINCTQRVQEARLKLQGTTNKCGALTKTQIELDLETAQVKESKPTAATGPTDPLFGIGSTTSTHGLGMPAPSASSKIDAKQPIMGGLVDGCCRKEAWVGGKPRPDWLGSEDPNAIDFPQPTQM